MQRQTSGKDLPLEWLAGLSCCWRLLAAKPVVLLKTAAQRGHVFRQHAVDCHCRLGHLPAGYIFGYLLGEVDDMFSEVIFSFANDYSAEVSRLSTTCV